MSRILVVVESPAKIEKLKSFLGKGYEVKASMGIFRDLDPHPKRGSISIDIDNNFEPIYVIVKPDVVKNLRAAMAKADVLYVASDLDLEGDGIAQSLIDILKPKKYKRLIFNAINKKAILDSIKNAGPINTDRVDAQKTRRVLDRIYGYLISPIIQKKVGGKSAGRVQSPTTRLVVDKENEINNFLQHNTQSFFKGNGVFSGFSANLFETDKFLKTPLKGSPAIIRLVHKTPDARAIVFLKRCLKSTFLVHSTIEKNGIRNPAPPFITSTLQQEANRKISMSIDTTMRVAQKLYENGHITYMRTDSVSISPEAHEELKQAIEKLYGTKYYKKTEYKNKSDSSQEAHEAVRPVHPEISLPDGLDPFEQKLYSLIWKRTLASQMAPAKIKTIVVQIVISKYVNEPHKPFYYFQGQLEKIVFPGFMTVYVESVDDEHTDEGSNTGYKGNIPEEGSTVIMERIDVKQQYPNPPPRYTQASLVKKIEALGIGRPSTYVNAIKVIMDVGYVEIRDIPGTKKEITNYSIRSEKGIHIMQISQDKTYLKLGQETKKIVPTHLGIEVTNFLVNNFANIMDYAFTANMEADMDDIANGQNVWHDVVRKYYTSLLPVIERVKQMPSVAEASKHSLGTKNKHEYLVIKTKNGPAFVRKDGDDVQFANIPDGLEMNDATLNDAMLAFKLKESYPKVLGQYQNKDVTLRNGKFGIYLVYDDKYPRVKDKDVTDSTTLDDAIDIIKEFQKNMFGEFEYKDNKVTVYIKIFNGPHGPYISVKKGAAKPFNRKIPENIDPKTITLVQVKEIIETPQKQYSKAKGGGKKTIRKTRK
jgi:DNA topoisomerase-1